MTLTLTDPLVGLAGDWHGHKHAVGPAIAAFAHHQIEHVFHVGDCGIWPGPDGAAYLHHLNRVCARHGVTLYITPGNHDDWEAILNTAPGADGLLWFADHVAVMPRGYRWTVADKAFLSLGGAGSINYADLTQGVDWWEQEAIGYGDALAAILGGPADVMITHDSPNGGVAAVQRLIDTPGDWSAEALAYTAESRAMITGVWHEVQPSLLAHGHHHLTANETVALPTGNKCQVVSLNKQDNFGNLAILDVGGDLPAARFLQA